MLNNQLLTDLFDILKSPEHAQNAFYTSVIKKKQNIRTHLIHVALLPYINAKGQPLQTKDVKVFHSCCYQMVTIIVAFLFVNLVSKICIIVDREHSFSSHIPQHNSAAGGLCGIFLMVRVRYCPETNGKLLKVLLSRRSYIATNVGVGCKF